MGRHRHPIDRAAIAAAYATGAPVAVIAYEHGCSPSVVSVAAKEAGLPLRRPRPKGKDYVKRKAVVRDYARWRDLRKVAKKNECSSSWVCNIVRQDAPHLMREAR